jgi:hypothetical protein
VPAFIDITGQKFGRLFVESCDVLRKNNRVTWLCICECGTQLHVTGSALRTGNTQSCGCLHRDGLVARNAIAAENKVYDTATYQSWESMKERCYSRSHKSYKDYGGRGITVCDRWVESFHNFLEDMGERPEGMTLDRERNNEGYCKENCRWATQKQQGNNQRSNVVLVFRGESHTTSEWADIVGIERHTIGYRIRRGWSVEDALTIKPLASNVAIMRRRKS